MAVQSNISTIERQADQQPTMSRPNSRITRPTPSQLRIKRAMLALIKPPSAILVLVWSLRFLLTYDRWPARKSSRSLYKSDRPILSNMFDDVRFTRDAWVARWRCKETRVRFPSPAVFFLANSAVYRPPKSLRNDLKTRPGKEYAFCGTPWNC